MKKEEAKTTLYQDLLSFGKSHVCWQQSCGEYKKQLQDLHDFVYVVESTPHPDDPTYSPMFLDCILHRDLWEKVQERLETEGLSYDVLDYHHMESVSHHLPDTQKRKLLFEMVGKWWFFQNTFAPALALAEALAFRDQFFRGGFAYLPAKFRGLAKTVGFPQAVQSLTAEEDRFLDRMIAQMGQPNTCCGCIPVKKSSFAQRLLDPEWQELPELQLYETEGIHVRDVEKAMESGEFLYMMVYNHHDCMDRGLYQRLYQIFQEETENLK